MSETPSKAAMEKANQLIREVTPPNVLTCATVTPGMSYKDHAFCHYIDQVDKVAREVDRVLEACGTFPEDTYLRKTLIPSITLPDEPEPLVEALIHAYGNLGRGYNKRRAELVAEALASRGLEIVEKRT